MLTSHEGDVKIFFSTNLPSTHLGFGNLFVFLLLLKIGQIIVGFHQVFVALSSNYQAIKGVHATYWRDLFFSHIKYLPDSGAPIDRLLERLILGTEFMFIFKYPTESAEYCKAVPSEYFQIK